MDKEENKKTIKTHAVRTDKGDKEGKWFGEYTIAVIIFLLLSFLVSLSPKSGHCLFVKNLPL